MAKTAIGVPDDRGGDPRRRPAYEGHSHASEPYSPKQAASNKMGPAYAAKSNMKDSRHKF